MSGLIPFQIKITKAMFNSLDSTKLLEGSFYLLTDVSELWTVLVVDSVKTRVQLTYAVEKLIGGINIKGIKATEADLPTTGMVNGDMWLVGNTTDGYDEWIYFEDLGDFENLGKNAAPIDKFINSARTEGQNLILEYNDGSTPLQVTLPLAKIATFEEVGMIRPDEKYFTITAEGLLSLKALVFDYAVATNKPVIDGTTLQGTMTSMNFLKYTDSVTLKAHLDSLATLVISNSMVEVPNEGIVESENLIKLDGRALTDAHKADPRIPQAYKDKGFFPYTIEKYTTNDAANPLDYFETVRILRLDK